MRLGMSQAEYVEYMYVVCLRALARLHWACKVGTTTQNHIFHRDAKYINLSLGAESYGGVWNCSTNSAS